MQEIELLAPVGSWEALEAAVQNGADAVYLSGKLFGARQYANNFDREELENAVKYCHIRNVKVFVTVNTLVTNEELLKLGEYLVFLYNIDVDAIIVQDLGVAKLARDLLPDFEIHASTQMSVHNLEGVRFLEELGFKRVVLAREMTKEEIFHVQKNTSLDIEVFVHGALCVGYSGQCLMSSLIGGRSGNRGRCAQPCRMTYSLVDMKKGMEIKGDAGDYLMSPRDLNTLENINEILKTGIKSLKIEGRMKRPEYVATVVGAYRRAIDQYISRGSSAKQDETTLKNVTQVFNRGFTKGYILGEKGKEIMGFTKPSNRGIKIGEVIAYDKKRNKVQIRITDGLSKGDGIEIWSQRGDNPGAIVENVFIKGEKKEKGNPGDVVEINFKHYVGNGSPVYKTSDVELLKMAKETYERVDKNIPLFGEIKGELGGTVDLLLWDENGNYIHKKGEYLIEKALKTPLTKERIFEQISKLGATPYVLKELNVELEDGIMIPTSELNQLRRRAVEALDRVRENHHNRNVIDMNHFIETLKGWLKSKSLDRNEKVTINVGVNNLKQLSAVVGFPIDTIYYGDISTIEEAIEVAKPYNIKLIPSFFRITEDMEIKEIKEKIARIKSIDGVMVSNLGLLKMMKDSFEIPVIADYSLNIFNNGAIDLLRGMKVSGVTLSPELTLKQMKDMISRTGAYCEAIIHGYLSMMVTKYCPISTMFAKESHCSICKHGQFGLKDRMNMIFPIMTNDYCKIQILNAQKLCLIEHIKDLLDGDIRNFRIQFTIEQEEEIKETLAAYIKTVKDINDGKTAISPVVEDFISKMKEEGLTKGHFFRGVQ